MSGIFIGNQTKLFYNNDAGNNIPNAPTFVQVEELAEFPKVKINTSANQYSTYNQEYTGILAGDKSIDSVNIVVHYVPNDVSHQYLDAAFASSKKFQIKVSLYESATSLDQHYAIINGYISSVNLSGAQNSVVDKTYVFTAEDVIARGTARDMENLKVGDYGVGANGSADIPQYESSTPAGNAFIKVPAGQAQNPTGVDMLGIAGVDGNNITKLAITESGILGVYAKNQSSGWQQLLTKSQNDAVYVPLTRTVNGKSLSTNIVLNSADTGSLALTGGTLTGALNGTTANFSGAVQADSATITGALTVNSLTLQNATIQNKATVKDLEVTGGMSVAGNSSGSALTLTGSLSGTTATFSDSLTGTTGTFSGALSADSLSLAKPLPITSGGTGNVNGTVARLTTAREIVTNLASNSSATFNGSANAVPGVTGILGTANGGTGNANGTVASLTTAREIVTNLASNSSATFNGTANAVPGVTGILGFANGGTGSNSYATARVNLGLDRFQQLALDTRVIDPTGKRYIFIGSKTSNPDWGVFDVESNSKVALPVSSGGTGATNANDARTNLGLSRGSVPEFTSIELYGTTPFIDFHYQNTPADFNVRLINDTNGVLNLANGRFEAGQGYCTKGGINSARGGSVFNINWESSVGATLWIDSSNMGQFAYNTSSDKGLKKDIVYLEKTDALSEVLQWQPVTYKYKKRGIIPESDTKYGFIANDLVKVSPETVIGTGLPEDYDIVKDPNMQGAYSLDTVAMISKLAQAIQQQNETINMLLEEINVLKK